MESLNPSRSAIEPLHSGASFQLTEAEPFETSQHCYESFTNYRHQLISSCRYLSLLQGFLSASGHCRVLRTGNALGLPDILPISNVVMPPMWHQKISELSMATRIQVTLS